MKTTFDVIDVVFPIINVAAVKATIDGRIYRYDKPQNSELRDITIGTLTVTNGEEFVVQPGVVMINAYAKNFSNGTRDEANLRAMANAIRTVIEAHSSGSDYFYIEIADTNIFADFDQKRMSYVSLRCNIIIQEVS